MGWVGSGERVGDMATLLLRLGFLVVVWWSPLTGKAAAPSVLSTLLFRWVLGLRGGEAS